MTLDSSSSAENMSKYEHVLNAQHFQLMSRQDIPRYLPARQVLSTVVHFFKICLGVANVGFTNVINHPPKNHHLSMVFQPSPVYCRSYYKPHHLWKTNLLEGDHHISIPPLCNLFTTLFIGSPSNANNVGTLRPVAK
jgi:hypothetical protein